MIGKRLGGRYEVEQRIGGGGMAVVYRAHDNLLNRTVALKVLRSQFGHDDDFIGRFRREAQAAASLSHPNIVNVYDVGEEDDIQYIVMEYVDGLTLKELIIQEGVLDVEQAVDYAIQICDALEHAHHNHIIHRDIKPHNILISKRGRVKVTDFGIARAVTSATITHTGSVIGSVHYFSPEQARGGISGEKSDIYSLGIVLYEMVTGKVPFSGDSPISVALKHLQENIVPPKEMNPNLPQSIENVILRALVKDPLHRYQSAKEMQRDLRTCLNPERLNEPKFIIQPEDEEATRVIPAITQEMMDQLNDQEGFEDLEEEKRPRASKEVPEKKSKNWLKSIGWVSFLSAFFILALYGFNLLIGIFYVPEVITPRVENMHIDEAKKLLQEKQLNFVTEGKFSDTVPKDMIVRQTPPPGMRVKENSEVTLYVSKGQQGMTMPDLIGLPERHIEVQLQKFAKVEYRHEASNEYASGVVMAQDPPAGQEVTPAETTVTITISKGKETVSMPDLSGQSLEEAEAILQRNGLKKGNVKQEPSYVEKGTVFRQYPFQPGSQASPGAEIELWVSSGYPSNAKVVSEPVMVVLDQPTADIRITVSDARGKDIELVNKKITQTDTFNVEVVLSPAQDATINIYRDGSLVENRNIEYASVP